MRLYNNSKSMHDVRIYVNDTLKHRGEPKSYNSGGMGSGDGVTTHPLLRYEQQQIQSMPQFYFQGVSLGLAYAHPDSGDTVGTVMYGGLRTVMNGPCRANTGQPVMWIFEFESALFDTDGRRIFANKELPDVIEDGLFKVHGGVSNSMTALDSKTMDRKRWNDRENANLPGLSLIHI